MGVTICETTRALVAQIVCLAPWQAWDLGTVEGKRTGFPGVLGGVYGPIKVFLQCDDVSFEASVDAVDGQRGTGQATSDAALRMACSNASGGWAPVIR